ncbi:MAG: kinase/pyrophosphorylase [Proteobacteria bacterium]|nr:kinase/pyrophosphorylase [Pseudomonadota bacterium]
MKRVVFFVSDSTGITAETFGHSLLTQFEHIDFDIRVLRYVDNMEKAKQACQAIENVVASEPQRPLVFSTLIDSAVRDLIAASGGVWFDLFDTFISPLQRELHQSPSHTTGRTHGVIDDSDYTARIDAINFTMANDDGISTRHYPEADIVLVGVSRTGKTPTCLYLALHYGVYAANYPLTEDDLLETRLPVGLKAYRDKLFGLTISADRLHRIRSQRRPASHYASLGQCRLEISQAEDLFHSSQIPALNTTTMSVEEIATTIMSRTGLAALSALA